MPKRGGATVGRGAAGRGITRQAAESEGWVWEVTQWV